MGVNWRDLTTDELERHFNPRVAVGQDQAQAYLQRFTEDSARVRERVPALLDVRYGPAPRQTLDVFPAVTDALGRPAPLMLYLHGGYWRALDKSDHSFLAPAAAAAGFCQVHLNYDLCPAVTLDDIVREVGGGLAFVFQHAAEWGADPGRIVVAGHSAGAQLAHMLLIQDWSLHGLPAQPVHGTLMISGIYEPEAVMGMSINQEVGLDLATARRNDCLSQPPRSAVPLVAAVGALEPEAWIHHTRSYVTGCRRAGVAAHYLVVPEADHFSVLDSLGSPHGLLLMEAARLARKRP